MAATVGRAYSSSSNGSNHRTNEISLNDNVSLLPQALYNLLNEPCPLGLRMKNNQSFCDLIQSKVSQDRIKKGGKEVTPRYGVAGPVDKIKASNFSAVRLRIGQWEEYYDLLEEFMSAVKQNYGEKVLVQFEVFANHNAFELLAKYKTNHLVFNDDVQVGEDKDEHTDADLDAIREDWVSYVSNFIFR